MTRWRFCFIEQAMLDAGLSAEEASAGAHAAMINFAKWRSRIDVPQQTHDTLKQLAKNGRWWRSPTVTPEAGAVWFGGLF